MPLSIEARPASVMDSSAELIAVQEKDLALKPKILTMEEAASIPLVGLTAWQALVERGQLKRGQKVFVQAGSGGVGTLAIQLAKHLGATIATTTSTSNVDLVRSLGADVIVDYKKDDFEAKLSEYDLVLHSQDGEALDKSLRVLRSGGRLVSISGPPDPDFAEEIGAPWFVKLFTRLLSSGARRKARSRNTTFSFLFMKANGDQLGKIAALIDAGHIRPVVDKVFPFQSTNEALAYVETGRAKGKVVIKVKCHERREVRMRYAPEHNDATRERILDAASRLFREHGIAAVGLAKIMTEAGLTVGTFYTHFKSKEALLREALLRSLDARHEELEQALQGADLEILLRAYLSPEHRDAAGTGCPIAALAAAPRRLRTHGPRSGHVAPLGCGESDREHEGAVEAHVTRSSPRARGYEPMATRQLRCVSAPCGAPQDRSSRVARLCRGAGWDDDDLRRSGRCRRR